MNKRGPNIWKLKHTKDITAWIKLDKDFFGLTTDTYVGNVYCVPAGSTHLIDDPFDILLQDISQLPESCQILICGDYNARTGACVDYIAHDTNGSNGDLDQLLPSNSVDYNASVRDNMIAKLHLLKMLNRFSQDKSLVNIHGRRLIDLCISCSLLILNGRLGSDNGVGAYTRIDTTGKSVADYMIGSPELFAISSDFTVHDKFPESDHVPLSIAINCRLSEDKPRKDRTNTNMWTKHYRYKWSPIALREL